MPPDETKTNANLLYDPSCYDADFFAEWGRLNTQYVRSARAVAEIIFAQYRPSSVLDLGAGAGFHAGRLKELGVQVTAADFALCPEVYRAKNIQTIERIDLTRPLENDRFHKHDMVLCVDVAEHLPDSASFTIVENCCKFADLVLFSAAPPHQGGTGHINEQPRRYWFERFFKAGFRHVRKETGYLDKRGLLRRDTLEYRWMITQIGVYRRGAKFPYPPKSLPAIQP